MSGSVFGRLVWKEYRLLRPFWVAVAAAALIGYLLVFMQASDGSDRVAGYFVVALILPAFYALACGATAFAAEHENGTYEFQRSLPVSPSRLLAGKIGFAVLSTPALFLTLWLAAAALSGRFPQPSFHAMFWTMWGLGAVELFVWGVFFSLLLRHPLRAAFFGAVAAASGVQWAASTMTPNPLPPLIEFYVAGLPLRLLIVLLVAAADVWLALRWLRERDTGSRGFRRRFARQAADDSLVAHRPGDRVPGGSILRRLIWQHWRQSQSAMMALGIMVLPLAVMGVVGWLRPAMVSGIRPGEHFVSSRVSYAAINLTFLGVIAAPLIGSRVFHADQQRHGFRFLAERGVRPRHVWLSRQLVWMPAAAAWTALVLPLVTCDRARPDVPLLAAYTFGFAVFAYASGQLCSMFFRSGVLAAFFAVVLTALLCAWTNLMHALAMGWFWSVAPIPVVFLLATWLRTPHWLLEREDWRARLRAAASVLLPVAALFVAVCARRVYQVPAVDPGFSPAEFARPATPQALATRDLYRQAVEALGPIESYPVGIKPEGVSKWLAAHQVSINLTLEATRRKECDFLESSDADLTTYYTAFLADLLANSAVDLQRDGRLDDALDRYLAIIRLSKHLRQRASPRIVMLADMIEGNVYEPSSLGAWATQPDQTPERICRAIREIEKLTGDLPSRTAAVKSEYLRQKAQMEGDPAALKWAGVEEDEAFWTGLCFDYVPWERARADRMLNALTANALGAIRIAESAGARGESIPDAYAAYVSANQFYYSERWSRMVHATPLLYRYPYDTAELVNGVAQMEARRRAARLNLALAAWKLEHGTLPDSLDELVGPYLDKLPADPYSGQPFGYVRQGVPITLTWALPRSPTPLELEPGTPFLWSRGAGGLLFGPSGEAYNVQEITDGKLGRVIPQANTDLRRSAWPFPIPQ